jgi:hypothetical protein
LYANRVERPANCWLSRIVQLSQRRIQQFAVEEIKKYKALAKRQIPSSKEIKPRKWYDFETPYQTIIDYIAHKIKIQFKIASLN